MHNPTRLAVYCTTLFFALALGLFAADRKELKDVEIDAFTTATQVSPVGAGDNHLAMAWWIPSEFWESVLSRDDSFKKKDVDEMLETLEGYSMLAVVQADISAFGAFRFYRKNEVEKSLRLQFTDGEGKKHPVKMAEKVAPELQFLLESFRPMFTAAMGNLGKNFHFFVLDDVVKGERFMDPYEVGTFDIGMEQRDETKMKATLSLPLDPLFVPRKCPNGKDAHISWSFCPWTGKKLEE